MRCQALTDEFEQCSQEATAEVEYSGDVKEHNPKYVLVRLCGEHAGKRPGRYDNKEAYEAG